MSKKFARQDSTRFVKLGSRKSKKTWRKPHGTQSKIRRQRRSYPASPKIGRRVPNAESGKIANLYPILISNIQDMQNATKESLGIVSARLGAKKRLEIIKIAKEKNIKLLNIKNPDHSSAVGIFKPQTGNQKTSSSSIKELK